MAEGSRLRNMTGNGVGGATIIRAAVTEGDELPMLDAKADLEGTSFMLHL